MKVLQCQVWTYEYRCLGCQSMLEATAEDCRMGYSRYYPDKKVLQVVCPVCDMPRDVESFRCSPKVVEQAEERTRREAAN